MSVARSITLSLLALLLAAAPAPAQDSGVTYDPDSPAGKEYALPLQAAREQARGGHDDAAAGEQDAAGAAAAGQDAGGPPLFGQGVRRAGDRERSRDGDPGASRSGAAAEDRPSPVPGLTVREALTSDGPGALLIGGGVALLAAALAAVAGISLRRSRGTRQGA